MEASQEQGPQEGQADVDNGAQDSQQEPQDDSQLQTPQPDQPVPSEAERQEQAEGPTAEVGPSGQLAEGTAKPAQFPSNEEQVQAEEQRQSELQAQRDEHNERAAAGVPRPTEAERQATRQDAERATAEEQAQQDQG